MKAIFRISVSNFDHYIDFVIDWKLPYIPRIGEEILISAFFNEEEKKWLSEINWFNTETKTANLFDYFFDEEPFLIESMFWNSFGIFYFFDKNQEVTINDNLEKIINNYNENSKIRFCKQLYLYELESWT